MTLPYLEPLEPRTLSAPVIPEPPRRGEPGGPPCGSVTRPTSPASGATTTGRSTRRSAAAFPARSGWRRGARGLVHRPVTGGGRDFGRGRAGRARDPVPRWRGPRPPLPLGRRRRPLPRLVHASSARHGRGVGYDAAALGGRPAERDDDALRRAAEESRKGSREPSTTAELMSVRTGPLAAGSAPATRSSSGCAR